MRVVIVDDVITSGRSIREAVELVRGAAKVEVTGVVVAVDRQERGRTDKTTLAELRDDLGLNVLPVVDIRQIVEALHGTEAGKKIGLDDERKDAIGRYLAEHAGAS
jgi:orotate phosphoribosyltransferase